MAADELLQSAIMDRLRVLCLGMPEAEEVEAWDVPTFRVRNKIFAMARTGDGRLSVSCKAPRGIQEILVTREPSRYYVPAYTGHNGWIGIWLDVDDDWEPVEEAILESYRMTAPKKLAAVIQSAAGE